MPLSIQRWRTGVAWQLALVIALAAGLLPLQPAAAEPTDSLVTFALLPSRTPFDAPAPTRPPALANPHGDISIPCEACHTPDAWTPLRTQIDFDHSAQTQFVMTGKHTQLECSSCHLDLRFDRPDFTADECASCHLDVHRGQLGDACETCHNTQDFHLLNGQLIHAQTTFPLTGSHLQVTCESCHTEDPDGLFAPLNTDCLACHAPEYQTASSIDHVAAGFSTDCEQCHSTLAFSSAGGFDHAAASDGFALVGTHAELECAACHTVPGFEPIFEAAGQNDCFACHQSDYERTVSIDHVAAGFPTDCLQCHGVTTWENATFEHAAVADGFALVGAHAPLPCSSCHVGQDFDVAFDPDGQNDCFACHAQDHEEEHPAFPTDCLQCHTATTWDDADFNHAVVSEGFQLVGAHVSIECSACHIGPDFEPIFDADGQNDCFACHAEEHEDEHPTFPTNCLECHTVDTWDSADFDHNTTTDFDLVGAHVSLPCSSCHVGPDFDLVHTPTGQNDCVACHMEDTEDEHPGFPSDCLQCHTVDTWDGADFNHAPYFPIYSGRHAGEWANCQTCHTQPGNYAVFTCLTCHEHSRPEMDDEHDEVGGYVYESNACLSCHPDGDDLGSRHEFDIGRIK